MKENVDMTVCIWRYAVKLERSILKLAKSRSLWVVIKVRDLSDLHFKAG